MKRTKLILLLSSSVLGIGFLFQNCSRVPLEKFESVSEYAAPTTSLKASMCGESRAATAGTGKFVFVIDMSASNLGKWTLDTVRNGWYWDKSAATDLNGDRLKSVEAFLDNFNGSNAMQFAIVGFSNGAGMIDLNTKAWKRDGLTFVNVATAKAQLKALKDLQTSDYAWYDKWNLTTGISNREWPVPDSVLMQATSYTSALGVAEDIVINDLLSSNAQGSSYRIFFLSDGAPEDKANSGCNVTAVTDQEACYIEKSLSSMTVMGAAALARGRDLKVNGIFYSKDVNVPSKVLDILSREGGTGSSLKLNDFKSQQDILSKLASSSSSLDVRPDSMQAFVLTAFRKDGKLVADSDMDGLADIDEIELQSNSQNPRSRVSGVLDGICMRFGGFSQCEQKRLQITCDPNLYNNLYLTDCDYRILGLNKLQDSSDSITNWGVDTDRDGIPDFVEIIKGLNPSEADTTLDTDGDGMSSLEEIIVGRDPSIPDMTVPVTQLNQISMKFNVEPISYCTAGAWELSLDRMQVARTYAVTGLPAQALNHEKNQHVVLFNYRRSAINSTQAVWEVQSRAVKVAFQKEGSDEQIILNESRIIPTDFVDSGRVKK